VDDVTSASPVDDGPDGVGARIMTVVGWAGTWLLARPALRAAVPRR
jgi:hypothetical protein